MTRRDMIRRFLSVVATPGAAVTVRSLPAAETPPALVVIECPGRISATQAANLKAAWREAMTGPAFDGTKVAILDEGRQLHFYDMAGRRVALQVEHDEEKWL